MKKIVLSSDQTQICYELTGQGETALLFSHGWLGNKRWWDAQRDFFSKNYLIAQMDLAGHGESGKTRTNWTAKNYADDIIAVANSLPTQNIILIGHSMSGAYVTAASLQIPKTKKIILVDTLKDLDQTLPHDQVDQILQGYLKDFKSSVENVLPLYLFSQGTPAKIKAQIQNEFLSHNAEFAVKAIEPLFKTDFREFASKIKIPVRAINSNYGGETNLQNNRKYFTDFNFTLIEEVGHYPMMEKPEEFNLALESFL